MAKIQLKMDSKIGPLFLVGSENALHGIFWKEHPAPMIDGTQTPSEMFLRKAAQELEEYLNGTRRRFDVALDPQGTTFQKRVWAELCKIPYGETRSYKDVAIALSAPKASRAVGSANGLNPLCIVVPCHRVISADGSLGGYSGGLEVKKALLNLEQNLIHESPCII